MASERIRAHGMLMPGAREETEYEAACRRLLAEKIVVRWMMESAPDPYALNICDAGKHPRWHSYGGSF